MLSANSEAPAIIEELHGGRDFRASVSRAQLEAMAGDWFTRAAAPLLSLLSRNNMVRSHGCTLSPELRIERCATPLLAFNPKPC